jgi:hypothetical protein
MRITVSTTTKTMGITIVRLTVIGSHCHAAMTCGHAGCLTFRKDVTDRDGHIR